MRHLCSLFLSVVALQSASLASAQPSRNLAYEDRFVWYVSGRLASELVEWQKQKQIGKSFTEGEWAEQRDQFDILYHRYLIDCEGPLTKVAEVLKYFDLQTEGASANELAYVGAMNYRIWPLIQSWRNMIVFQMMDTYSLGHYGFFPECVVAGYREQNPIPAMGSK